MHVARGFHTATLLRDGRVLVAGGYDASGHPTASAEIYNPGRNRFRYKLKNYEDELVTVGNDQHIRFSRLPYGSYVLVVNATNTSGNGTATSQSVIDPPLKVEARSRAWAVNATPLSQDVNRDRQ